MDDAALPPHFERHWLRFRDLCITRSLAEVHAFALDGGDVDDWRRFQADVDDSASSGEDSGAGVGGEEGAAWVYGGYDDGGDGDGYDDVDGGDLDSWE